MELWREVLLFQARERHIETEGQKIQKINFKQIIFLLLLLSILFVCIYNLWCFHTHYYRTSSMPVGGESSVTHTPSRHAISPCGLHCVAARCGATIASLLRSLSIAIRKDDGTPFRFIRRKIAIRKDDGTPIGSFAQKLPSGKMMARP